MSREILYKKEVNIVNDLDAVLVVTEDDNKTFWLKLLLPVNKENIFIHKDILELIKGNPKFKLYGSPLGMFWGKPDFDKNSKMRSRSIEQKLFSPDDVDSCCSNKGFALGNVDSVVAKLVHTLMRLRRGTTLENVPGREEILKVISCRVQQVLDEDDPRNYLTTEEDIRRFKYELKDRTYNKD